jgi:NADH-quinone oxidoreductase subunit J
LAIEPLLFYLFAALAVVSSLLVIGQRNPVYSVVLIIVSFAALAGLYVLLEAPFAAVIQIIVYAGAIMVLFLFVVMLLNVPREATDHDTAHPFNRPGARRIGAALTGVLLLQLGWAVWHVSTRRPAALASAPPGDVSSVREIGRVLFTDYALPFEATSLLILVAMVGAIILARARPSSE